MTLTALTSKMFLKAMKLPDDQRRIMLETLGAKMMDQLKAERKSLKHYASPEKLIPKDA